MTDAEQPAQTERPSVDIPPELRESPSPVVFVDTSDLDLSNDDDRRAAYEGLQEAIDSVLGGGLGGQSLIKLHIGEPKCETRLDPRLAPAIAEVLKDHGLDSVAAGDTTVAYTGDRGHRKNPEGDVSAYTALARSNGWAVDGPAEMPFVVLDRPCSAVDGVFEFERSEREVELDGVERFDDFFPAGGLLAADTMVNLAHLTLHGLAGVAGCVKGIAMGCSALEGKLRMHQSLLPNFDPDLCRACGRCVRECPEGALTLDEGAETPTVDPDLCIGCGECEAICASHNKAVVLREEEIEDWERGRETLPLRLTDYTVGVMQDRWMDTVQVLSMHDVTERCDCLDTKQSPMIDGDMGFLVGRNPFAIDRLGGRMLADRLRAEGKEADRWELTTAERCAEHAHEAYGIAPDAELDEINVSALT